MGITKDNLDSYFSSDSKYRRLTRKFEADLPTFNSRERAYEWFRELFGSDFVLTGTDEIDGETCWFYSIVHDRKSWENGMKELEQRGFASGIDFVMSSQEVQIFDSGNVHIVF